MTNLATIQSLYAAFGRNDVPAILAHISEDVAWEYAPVSTDVPYLQARRGRQGVAEFFAIIGAELAISRFEIKQLLVGERTVAALIDIDFTVKRTGKLVREVDEVHLWHFDDRGHVARFRHVPDTHQHYLAWHG